MHLLHTALVTAIVSANIAPTIALAVEQSKIPRLNARDDKSFDSEGECQGQCSGTCEAGFWGGPWHCNTDVGLTDPNNGVPRKARLLLRDEISNQLDSTVGKLAYQESNDCLRDCTNPCAYAGAEGLWYCTPTDNPELSPYPVAGTSDQGAGSNPKPRLRSRIDTGGMTFGDQGNCEISCSGSCTVDSSGAIWTCNAFDDENSSDLGRRTDVDSNLKVFESSRLAPRQVPSYATADDCLANCTVACLSTPDWDTRTSTWECEGLSPAEESNAESTTSTISSMPSGSNTAEPASPDPNLIG